MQTLKTKLELAKWRDRNWQYQPADSHHHSHDFYLRQIARGLRPKDKDADRAAEAAEAGMRG